MVVWAQDYNFYFALFTANLLKFQMFCPAFKPAFINTKQMIGPFPESQIMPKYIKHL